MLLNFLCSSLWVCVILCCLFIKIFRGFSMGCNVVSFSKFAGKQGMEDSSRTGLHDFTRASRKAEEAGWLVH